MLSFLNDADGAKVSFLLLSIRHFGSVSCLNVSSISAERNVFRMLSEIMTNKQFETSACHHFKFGRGGGCKCVKIAPMHGRVVHGRDVQPMDEICGNLYLIVPGSCQHWAPCNHLASILPETFPLERACKHSPCCCPAFLSNEN